MVTEEEYHAVRNVVQFYLVPIIFVIGVLGNTLSIIVLTRKQMRCSTNIYLTALAVADIVYLTMFLIMSAEHYETIKQVAIYWKCRGISQWLIDSSSYISLYIIVCFTIERYIAVCHPMKGQVFCTEERAKKVIAIVVIVVLLSIITTNFEFEIKENKMYLNKTTGVNCSILPNQTYPNGNTSFTPSSTSSTLLQMNQQQSGIIITTPTTKITPNIPDEQYYYGMKEELRSTLSKLEVGNNSNENKSFSSSSSTNDTGKTLKDINEMPVGSTARREGKISMAEVKNSTNDCHYVRTYETTTSALGLNKTYRRIFDIFTIICYSFVPLILIIIFNSLLIRAVQKSNRLRDKMTNISVRQLKHQRQENKITIILIAVVISFMVCQTPWAIYLSINDYVDMDKYLKKCCGNIFNMLVAIDAASNFILYCALSDKYRKTLKELFMGNKYKRQDTLLSRQDTLASSWYNYRYKSFKKSEPNDNNHRNQGRKSIGTSAKPLPSVSTKNSNKPSAGMSSSFRHKLSENDTDKHLSLRPTVSFHNHPVTFLNEQTSATTHNNDCGTTATAPLTTTTPTETEMKPLTKFQGWRSRHNSTTSTTENGNNNVNMTSFLRSGDSSSSLTRSQSLILEPKIKHSPDCPQYNSNF